MRFCEFDVVAMRQTPSDQQPILPQSRIRLEHRIHPLCSCIISSPTRWYCARAFSMSTWHPRRSAEESDRDVDCSCVGSLIASYQGEAIGYKPGEFDHMQLSW